MEFVLLVACAMNIIGAIVFIYATFSKKKSKEVKNKRERIYSVSPAAHIHYNIEYHKEINKYCKGMVEYYSHMDFNKEDVLDRLAQTADFSARQILILESEKLINS